MNKQVSSMVLLVAVSDRLHACTATLEGERLTEHALDLPPDGDYLPSLSQLWQPAAMTCLALPIGSSEDRTVAEEWARQLGAGPTWLCTSADAVLAGALGAQPGLVLHDGEMLGRDKTGQTVSRFDPLCSRDGIVQEFAQLGRQLPRVARALGDDPIRAWLELASFPGPEPACRALVAKLARHASDLARMTMSRLRLESPRGSWSGPQWREPLLEAFQTEVKRYLPQVRWSAPRYSALGGCLLLLKGALGELRRRHPEGPPPMPELAWIDQDDWRQARQIQELPAWR